MLSMATRGD
jgi:hypothetical protein